MDRQLKETGSFQITRHNVGQERNVRIPETEDRVLQRFSDSPSTSSQSVSVELNIRHKIASKFLRAEKMLSFHVQKIHLLLDADYSFRTELVRCMLDATQSDSVYS